MSELEKRAIPFICALSLLGYVMSTVMPSDEFGRHWYAREDGLLETLTALALMAGAIICVYRCWQLRNQRPKQFLVCAACWGLILLFGMGEEISWGQRIFNVESPQLFIEHNCQSETNLHNLVFGNTSINKLVFGKFLGAAVIMYLMLPVFYRRFRRIRHQLNRMAVPVPRIYQIAAVITIAVLVETSGAKKRGEITEFAFASLGLLMLINPANSPIFRKRPATNSPDQAIDDEPVILTFPTRQSKREQRSTDAPRRRAA
jgi:hypothetical protein